MTIGWTSRAVDDVARLHEFLAPVNRRAAASVIRALTGAAARLSTHPRLGEKLEQYEPREVRRLLVGSYELRYEVRATQVVVLRVWHVREDR